jgi:hypothetical protein
MRAAVIAWAWIAFAASPAGADRRVAASDDDSAPLGANDRVVVVNAAAKLADLGQITRVRQVLGKRGMLLKLPDRLEATLEGRDVLVSDLEAIKEAYAQSNFAGALALVEADRERILRDAASRDPMPALAELSQWHGIVAAANNDPDEALRQFRAAYRFNPAWAIDKRLASPRVRALIKKAHVEPEQHGVLRVSADPDDAKIAVDGGESRGDASRLELAVGVHLVVISADGRKPYAELVTIDAAKPYKLAIALDRENKVDRAAKLVEETVAAPSGKPRLKHTKALAQLAGVNRLLVIEDGGEDRIAMRVYDVRARKVSKLVELDGDTSAAVIAREVTAALEPDNMLDADAAAPARAGDTPWYGRWYVWAGAAVVLGGAGVLGYEALHHAQPATLRGF